MFFRSDLQLGQLCVGQYRFVDLTCIEALSDELNRVAYGRDENHLDWFREDRASDYRIGLKLIYIHVVNIIGLRF